MEKELEMKFKDYMSIYEIAVEKFNKNPNNEYFINKLKESIQELPIKCKITKVNLENNYFDEKYGQTVNELYSKETIYPRNSFLDN
ncbi:hypothetical protein [Bacillus sp. 007/AIA-02/001]|uniref:hypothetical protein n=1 Tax=Bacillus sp. 007/AIA-02/001 TaxID=2509009 RepID=UPI001F0F8077|nr:hypothetical protein [Bacillus sp. 007/AIA-02/001]